MRTDTLAIVFTDIKGYTAKTSSQSYKDNAKLLKQVERVVEPVVKGFNGRVIKNIGDAYMIVFRSPTEAAQCAAAVQDRLYLHNQGVKATEAIHIRIAMNIGEVRVHRGDVFGEPVNIAARVEGVTPADEVYLSEAVYLTMNRTNVPSELVGEYELKGIPEPVRVYRIRKFAQLDDDNNDDASNEEGETGETKSRLPYGGLQLAHWRKVRWLRRVYQLMWLLALCGIIGGAVLRYWPSSDYQHLVLAAQAAAGLNAPMEILASTGQIPDTAIHERRAVRRYRRQAVDLLIERKDYDTAKVEIASLLAEDPRDAESLILRGLWNRAKGRLKAAIKDMDAGLRLDKTLGKRQDVVATVVAGYGSASTRGTADSIVERILGKDAVKLLVEAVNGGSLVDRTARLAAAERLDKLGANSEVDWIVLAIDDLKTTSCRIKKAAIDRLMAASDDRAVGPLLKVADSRGCHAGRARRAVNAIIK